MTDLRSSGHKFATPPVYETALAVQFQELTSFRTVHFGLLYEIIKDRFSITEEHPRLEPIFESFPIAHRLLMLRLSDRSQFPERVWFRDSLDGALLLQVQPDRFGLNWRRKSDGNTYPSFSDNGQQFLRELDVFQQFCEDNSLGKLVPSLSEVIYVNHIFPEADESAVACLERIMDIESPNSRSPGLQTERVTLNRVYCIGESKGRLYAEAGIGRNEKDKDFVVLKMTARVLHCENEAIAKSIQMAHDAVVDGFVAITSTDAKNKRWGKIQ